MFELKITASSLEELWNTLSTFQNPQNPQRADISPRVSAATADTNGDTTPAPPVKRGPGRPPGSSNKSKPGTLPPAFAQSIKADPNEPDAEEPEEDADQAPEPDTTVDDDAKDDET